MSGADWTLLMRAIRGPILLITVGALFAIDHAGGYGFVRTWPVLIIVLGILKLLERTAGRGPMTGGAS